MQFRLFLIYCIIGVKVHKDLKRNIKKTETNLQKSSKILLIKARVSKDKNKLNWNVFLETGTEIGKN